MTSIRSLADSGSHFRLSSHQVYERQMTAGWSGPLSSR
ncbi:hypothetical protein STENM223S_03967 [Streptomyces tendae]